MTWWIGLSALLYCSLVVNFVAVWAAFRAVRKHGEAQMDAHKLQIEAIELATLLREIAVASFMQAHHGTFKAWSESMGALHVKVTADMHRFSED